MTEPALGPIARAGAGLAQPPRVSFEFSPPKTEEAEVALWEAIRRLAPLNPAFVSVTYGAGGSTRDRTHRTVSRILAETQLAPAAHLTCVDASRAEVDEVIRDYWDAGVRHIVALRGDPPGQIGGVYLPRTDGYLNATELTAGIRAIGPFEVSVSLYPQTHPESGSIDHDIDVLKAKIDAGDRVPVVPSEARAREVTEYRARQKRERQNARTGGANRSLVDMMRDLKEGAGRKELPVVIKGDVQGSVEAIIGSLRQIPQNEVQIRMLLATAGEITETDIDLAAASNAVIIGFNTTYASGARQAADEAGVDVREYNIIYKLLEDIQGALEGLLEPELVEEPLGQTEVRAVFPVGRGAVAGCYVQSGKLVRNCKVRVRRYNKVVYEGVLDSLKRMKEDAREVNAGYECGIGIDKFHDWVENDIIESYQLVTKRRTLTMTK